MRRLRDAQQSVPHANLTAGPGTLYAADLLDAVDLTSFRKTEGSECLGWSCVHQGRGLPTIRLISAPHWLKCAVSALRLCDSWRFSRLVHSWVFQLLDQNFTDAMPVQVVEDVTRRMKLSPAAPSILRCPLPSLVLSPCAWNSLKHVTSPPRGCSRPVDSIDDPARLFSCYGRGLLRMGSIPAMPPGATYKLDDFWPEVDVQHRSLPSPHLVCAALCCVVLQLRWPVVFWLA